MLLVELSLEGSLDFVDFFLAANGFLDPRNYEILAQVCKRDQVFGALEADGAVSASRIGAVVGIHGVVGGEDETISGLAFQVGNVPGEDRGRCFGGGGSGHGKNRFCWSLVEVQPVGNGRLPAF